MLHQPFAVYPLIGPAIVAEMEDCLDALDVELDPEQVAWLNLADKPVLEPATR